MDELQKFLFLQGNCAYSYEFLGAHLTANGCHFAVWAPNALEVSVVGDFNNWNQFSHKMKNKSGIWELEIESIKLYDNYKYAIRSLDGWCFKADPYAFHSQTRPQTASKVYDLSSYQWGDAEFMQQRAHKQPLREPINIYELHLGSWRLDEQGRLYTYERMADEMVAYVKDLGYTHVEFMPVMEHPFDGSWGYQLTGYFAANSRFGDPKGLMRLIDRFHQAGIGVILDWVPAHFPKDEHGLYRFDGTCTYEHPDTRLGENVEWGTCNFDYSRNEVRSFLKSSAAFWLREFHADGIRVDAVSFMIYTNYCKKDGQWLPNKDGGIEHYEAISLLQEINILAYRDNPGIMMIAEEATSFPKVTAPVSLGGLGFGFKWNMGWRHDCLEYLKIDPFFRSQHHNKMTFSLTYSLNENYILAFSHDDVVHGKLSMLNKMYGDIDVKFASLRALMGYMFAHPGKKLNFMGNEFAQFIEWEELEQLDWFLMLYESHPNFFEFTKQLNHFYKSHPALYSVDDSWEGFEWCDADDAKRSVYSFIRSDGKNEKIVAVVNFTPVSLDGYMLALPLDGRLREVFNSDDAQFGGSGVTNGKKYLRFEEISRGGRKFGARIKVPPMSAVYYEFKPYAKSGSKKK